MTCEEAAQTACRMMTLCYGNPSSLHSKGHEAAIELEKARASCAGLLGCEKEEIFFTSGGTESNNTAVFGAARALKRRGNKIITTAFEHSSVGEAVQQLEKDGFEVICLKPDQKGRFSPEELREVIDDKTILVMCQTYHRTCQSAGVISRGCRAGIRKTSGEA